MSTDLSIFQSNNNELAGLVAQGNFIPYLSLIGKQSEICDSSQHQKLGFVPGNFMLSNTEQDKSILVGRDNSFEALMGPSNPKAMLFRGNAVECTSYNPTSPDFKRIKMLFDTGSEKAEGVAANYGIETLFFIPIDQFNFDSCINKEYVAELKKNKYFAATFFWARHSGKYAPYYRGARTPLARLKITASLIPSSKPFWSANKFETLSTTVPDDITEELAQMSLTYKQQAASAVVIDEGTDKLLR